MRKSCKIKLVFGVLTHGNTKYYIIHVITNKTQIVLINFKCNFDLIYDYLLDKS